MTYPLVLDLAADKIPVAVTCRVLGFSKQAFYAWKQNPVSQRDRDDAYVISAALDVHRDDPGSGTGSSPMSCPPAGSLPGRTRWPGCAPSSASGRHLRRSAA
jgi:putative transposase